MVQTALSFIKLGAPDSLFVNVLSLLTFAQGGMYAGFIGAVGGVVGKMLLAGMLTKLVMGKKGRPPKRPKPAGGSAKLFLPGLGAGLIAYNFLTGNAALGNAMIGVTTAIAVFRTAGNPEAFSPAWCAPSARGKPRPALPVTPCWEVERYFAWAWRPRCSSVAYSATCWARRCSSSAWR